MIIVGIITLGGIGVINLNSQRHNNVTVIPDVWAQAFRDVESSRVGIVFNGMSTTEDEYGKLRLACNKYIEELNRATDLDTSVNVDIKVNENTFVDNETNKSVTGTDNKDEKEKASGESSNTAQKNQLHLGNTENIQQIEVKGDMKIPDLEYWLKYASRKSNLSQYSLVETGPVYFDNMVMIRYINSNGDLSVITGAYSFDKSNIVVLKQNEIEGFYTDTYLNLGDMNKINLTNSDNSDTTSTTDTTDKLNTNSSEQTADIVNDNTMSEEEYLKEVSECISKLLLARNNLDEKSAMSNALMYFTSDGKESVLSSRSIISIEDDTEISLLFGLCGKSNTSKNIKDRIYLQYEVRNGDDTSKVNIIVKLNSNLRIFDIDII